MKSISLTTYHPFKTSMAAWLPWLALLAVITLSVLWPTQAHASTSSGASLPWESPLNSFKDSITGPVAFAISILGIIGCGAALIWGGEISDFVRKMIMVILVISILVFANKILITLFQTSGAVIPLSVDTVSSPTTSTTPSPTKHKASWLFSPAYFLKHGA